jgi:hypothetical protein
VVVSLPKLEAGLTEELPAYVCTFELGIAAAAL